MAMLRLRLCSSILAMLFTSLRCLGGTAPLVMHTTQTAFQDGKNPDLLKEMPDIRFGPADTPTAGSLVIDRTARFQEIFGFGGAFTEAAAHNWKRLSADDQAKVIKLYFADPKDGGHGYTMGRVPMGSSDFSVASYNFDNVSGDESMTHFDTTVSHDEASGILPMIRAAQEMVKTRPGTMVGTWYQELRVFASPWSPPAWMKKVVNGVRSMTGSAQPLGLEEKYQRAWATYFSAFINAYKERGVNLWGVTPQNEPEFAAGWEACVYTPEFEATFVRDHLGPVLNKDHPGLKIIGFDHNKDHVVEWATALYADDATAKFFDGIGVHWYGGLNAEHLNTTHHIQPDKFILPTEACNCGGVVLRNQTQEWWSRAEKLAIDILTDVKWWSAGWIDWNLVLDTSGGPNHLGNLCDANILVDPDKTVQGETIILQASYYFMGQFSRFIPPGSRRIGLTNTVKLPPVEPSSLLGARLRFNPCSNGDDMAWSYDSQSRLVKAFGLCMELDTASLEAVMMQPCTGEFAQQWVLENANGGQLIRSVNVPERCITSRKVAGPVVGLDPGVDVEAGLAEICEQVPDTDVQAFTLENAGGHRFPEGFHIRTNLGNCMIPVGSDTITFDAVAFETPAGDAVIVAMNMGEADVSFDIHDTVSKLGTQNVVVPRHGIASFTLVGGESILLF